MQGWPLYLAEWSFWLYLAKINVLQGQRAFPFSLKIEEKIVLYLGRQQNFVAAMPPPPYLK